MSNLTKIASLPMGPGCLSSLPPEVGREAPIKIEPMPQYLDEEESSAEYWVGQIQLSSIRRYADLRQSTVQMKAAYFWDEEAYPAACVDWPVIVPGMLE